MEEMTNEEYIEFLNTINTLPKKEYEIIKRGVLQINDDKKQLVKEIERLNNIINELNNDIYSLYEDICNSDDSYKYHMSHDEIIDRLDKLSNKLDELKDSDSND